MIKTLLKYVGKYKKKSILASLFTAVEVFTEIFIPFVASYLIDTGVNLHDMANVYKYGTIMFILSIACMALGTLGGKFASEASSGFAANLREGIYRNIQKFSFSNMDKYGTPSLITRMTTDITNVQDAYKTLLRITVRAPLVLIISMIMCFITNVKLSLIFLIAIVVLSIALAIITMKSFRLFAEVFKKYDHLNEDVEENIIAIKVVKAYVREDYENDKFVRATEHLFKLFSRAEKILALNSPIIFLVIYSCFIALSWFGANFIIQGELTTGSITSLSSYIMSALMSLIMLSIIFVEVNISIASAYRIAEVLNEKSEIVSPEHAIMEVPDGGIVFNHVYFSYKDKNVLSDINISIKPCETVGIIGVTGSGKSTLVNLISRLYDVTEGSILVGGNDVKLYDLDVLRKEVSVVLQKNILFSGTILENLRWGNENATEEECKQACQIACADTFIEKFNDKYEKVIKRGGNNVSGGQRQRLCIARALLKKPKILILDDSTSAVDTITDLKIRKAFLEKIPNVTKIIISQRVSSIKDSDRILILDNGRVSGFDSHKELLKSNDLYRGIFESQETNGGDVSEE